MAENDKPVEDKKALNVSTMKCEDVAAVKKDAKTDSMVDAKSEPAVDRKAVTKAISYLLSRGYTDDVLPACDKEMLVWEKAERAKAAMEAKKPQEKKVEVEEANTERKELPLDPLKDKASGNPQGDYRDANGFPQYKWSDMKSAIKFTSLAVGEGVPVRDVAAQHVRDPNFGKGVVM